MQWANCWVCSILISIVRMGLKPLCLRRMGDTIQGFRYGWDLKFCSLFLWFPLPTLGSLRYFVSSSISLSVHPLHNSRWATPLLHFFPLLSSHSWIAEMEGWKFLFVGCLLPPGLLWLWDSCLNFLCKYVLEWKQCSQSFSSEFEVFRRTPIVH